MPVRSSRIEAACAEHTTAWRFRFNAFHVYVSLLIVAVIPLLTGCGNVSHGVREDGTGASQLVWPSPDRVTPMHRGGTFPQATQLQLIRHGMNKQQIAALIGYPHFSEGVLGVREWNYLFKFREEPSDHVAICQFKVLFDERKIARSFDWNPESCSRYMAVPISPTMAQAPEQQVVLSADAMFKFDRWSISDITDDGQAQFDNLAKNLIAEKNDIAQIHIGGYSDSLGGDDYDFALSQRRAYAVEEYLAVKGVPQALIHAEGRGKSDAVKVCPPMPKDALIACLAPNRRVVVQVFTRVK